MQTNLEQRQQVEIDYWKDSPTERPESESIENIVNKVADTEVFLQCINAYRGVFERSHTIVEIGAGQGWASCVVKRMFPNAIVTATDISEYALASIRKWEHIYQTRVDRAKHCTSYELGEPNSSVDCIFCFAAAHHFVAHRRTLREIRRVLKPGGHCFYFYEPSCREYLYRAALWRVNKKRPEVPEDVLVYTRIVDIAHEVDLNCSIEFYPSVTRRGVAETIYYSLLQKIPPLQRVLPCTINYHFWRMPENLAGDGVPAAERT